MGGALDIHGEDECIYGFGSETLRKQITSKN
jgi:hypothetical protein